jgi:hypothetical protein
VVLRRTGGFENKVKQNINIKGAITIWFSAKEGLIHRNRNVRRLACLGLSWGYVWTVGVICITVLG